MLCSVLALAQPPPSINDYVVPTPNAFPVDITTGPDGALWFTNGDNIGRITAAATFQEYPIPTAISGPQDITMGPDGALWFTEGQGNKIARITTAGVFNEYPLPTAFSFPKSITAGPDGALWFTEEGNDKIGRITTTGVLTEYPTPSSEPAGISVGPDGALWFTEAHGLGEIGRITTDGIITEYPIPTANSFPQGIAAGPDGALWFVEFSSNKIGRITTAGSFSEYAIPTAMSDAAYITAGPDGAMWFTEETGNNIGRITTDGIITEYPIPMVSSRPVGITVGPDGALWFTELFGKRIGRAAVSALAGPAISGISVPSGELGIPYTAVLSASGGMPPYHNWTISSGSLPQGLVLGPSTGIVSGIPTSVGSGTFSFNVTVQDSTGAISAAQSFVIKIAPLLQILSPVLPVGEVGTLYTNAISVTGGSPPYGWSVTSGSLPAGLALTINGFISGVPRALGTSVFTVRVTDAASFSVSQTFTVSVIAGGLTITTTSLPTGVAGTPYQQLLTASGGGPPYVWSIATSSLPAGLSLSSTGLIAGTPTAAGLAGLIVQVVDSASYMARQQLDLIIFPGLTITTTTLLPLGAVGTPYAKSLAVAGGSPPYAWSLIMGALPQGLTLMSDGMITGVPTAAGTSIFKVQVTDAASLTATDSFSLSIVPAGPTITTTTLPSGVVGVPYQQSLAAIVGTLFETWSVISGTLPSGLSLSSAGTITGTPMASGTQTFTVRLTDGNSLTATQTLSLTIIQGCSYTITPGGQLFPASGGMSTIAITTASGCVWSVTGIPAWVTLTTPASGGGSGSVSFQVLANSGADQSGSLTVAGQAFVIEQQAASIPGLTVTGSMPHIAAEGNWTTTFTLVNKSTTAAQSRFSLFGDAGSPLMLPLTFPQLPSFGPLLGASLDRTLAANASLIIEASGPSNVPVQVGSAQLAATGAVDGFAIFHLIPNAQEAVVPLETRNAGSYLLAFDNTNGIALGVALENVAAQAAAVPVVIRDDTGAQIGTDTLSLAANGHLAFTLVTDKYPATANKRGTIEFDTPPGGQISALGIRFTPPGTLTTIPVLANVGTISGSIAHIASGSGWQTTFVLINAGASAAQAHLKFFDDNGGPLVLPISFTQSGPAPIALVSSVDQTLAAGAMQLFQSASPDANLVQTGSAQLTTDGHVSGFVIFRYNLNGQEAVVPLESRNANAYVLAFDNTGGTATGIAVNSVSAQPINVPVIIRDDTGAQIGTGLLPLAGNGHSAFTLAVDKFPVTTGIRGTIEFDAPGGAQISALGIRIPPTQTFTTLPALVK